MFKQIKKALPIALVGVFAVASVAWATTAGVTGGNLIIASSTDAGVFSTGNPTTGRSVISGVSFDLGTIDASKRFYSATAADYLFVADNTGKNAGFVAKVSASPLTTTVSDATATGDVTVTIPAEKVLQVTIGSSTALFDSKLQAQANSGTHQLGSTAVNVLSANKGAGAGAFLTNLNYILTLPNYLPAGSTVTATASASAFKNVTDVTNLGLFAGSYSTTVAYTITAAP